MKTTGISRNKLSSGRIFGGFYGPMLRGNRLPKRPVRGYATRAGLTSTGGQNACLTGTEVVAFSLLPDLRTALLRWESPPTRLERGQ